MFCLFFWRAFFVLDLFTQQSWESHFLNDFFISLTGFARLTTFLSLSSRCFLRSFALLDFDHTWLTSLNKMTFALFNLSLIWISLRSKELMCVIKVHNKRPRNNKHIYFIAECFWLSFLSDANNFFNWYLSVFIYIIRHLVFFPSYLRLCFVEKVWRAVKREYWRSVFLQLEEDYCFYDSKSVYGKYYFLNRRFDLRAKVSKIARWNNFCEREQFFDHALRSADFLLREWRIELTVFSRFLSFWLKFACNLVWPIWLFVLKNEKKKTGNARKAISSLIALPPSENAIHQNCFVETISWCEGRFLILKFHPLSQPPDSYPQHPQSTLIHLAVWTPFPLSSRVPYPAPSPFVWLPFSAHLNSLSEQFTCH